MDTEANVRRYWAFISYSHTDKAWADWLHKSLERYPLPKDLVGRKTPSSDPAPKRFVPIFRDREELPTATDLGAVIAKALKHARFLVVICSPRSAKSQWVEQEIISYKRLYGENRVLCLIVDGEPWASDGKPGSSPEDECFPKAVRYQLGPDGNLSDQRTEPIAADARESGDGKQNAFIKLMAGLLGVGFDDLRRRDQEYQRRRIRIFRALTGLFALLFLAAISAATYAAIQKRKVQETLSQADLQLALVARDKDEISQSAAYLARSLRSDPANREAAVAAWSLLTHHQHHAPVGPALRHPNAVVAAVGSGDEKWIATGSGSEVYLWSRPDHKLVTRQSPDGSPVNAFSLDKDGKGFVVATRSGKIHHLSFDSLKRLSDPVATGSVPAIQIAWSPEGDQLAVALAGDDAGSNGGTLVRLSADGHELERIPASHLVPKVIAWSPDGSRIAVAGDSPNVLLATIGEHSSTTQTLKSKLAVTGLLFTTADQLKTIDVFTGLQTWDLVKGTPMEPKQLTPSVSGATFSPDGRVFLGTRRGPSAYVYDSSTGEINSEPISPGFTISGARWLDNRHVLITSENGLAQVRRVHDAIPAAAAACVPDGYPEAVALHPDGYTLAVAYTEDSLVRFYDTRTMTTVGRPVRFPTKVLSLGFSDDGNTLAVLGWDGHLHHTEWRHALKIETGKDAIIPPTDSSYTKATLGRFAPKGNVMVVPNGKELVFADLMTGTIKSRKSFDRKVACLTWTDDGSTLLVAREDQLLSFHRPDGSPAPNRPVIRLNAPAIELADGGERVAVLSNADRVDFFNSHSGAPTGTGFHAGANATGLQWDAAHEWVLTGDMDGRVSLWDPTAGQALGHLPRYGRIWHGGTSLPGRSTVLLRTDECMAVVPLLPPGPAPDWLASFLEGFCGNRLAAKKDETLIDVDAWRSPDATPSNGEKGPWADARAWLVSDATDRPAAPGLSFNESQTRDNLALTGKTEQLVGLQKKIQEEWNSNETPRMQKAADLLDDAIALVPGNTANHKVKVLMANAVENAALIRDANLGLARAGDATLIEVLDAKAEAAKQCLAMTPPQVDQARSLADEVLKENPEHAAALEVKKQVK